MSNRPLVSILINNYNYGQFLADAIESALHQTYDSVEIIVVDDGSTDQSHEVIERYGDRIIPVLKPNGGQASAFNLGFQKSRGDIICFLDADDIFVPEKAATIAAMFEKHPDIGWCFHRLRFVDSTMQTAVRLSHESGTRACDFRKDIQHGRFNFTAPATTGLCFGRSLLEQILPMPEEIRITSDNYLKLLAIALSKGFYLDEQLALLRIHGNNAYSLRNDKKALRAYTRVLTAYWARKKCSNLNKSANKLFAIGLGQLWKAHESSYKHDQTIHHYLASVALHEKPEIMVRAFYHYLKPSTH